MAKKEKEKSSQRLSLYARWNLMKSSHIGKEKRNERIYNININQRGYWNKET